MADLAVHSTSIPGLLVIDLPVHGDNRGWFKENWQRQKMVDLGLPDFGPVQNNVSYNEKAAATRGVHAEPWDKFVSVATGRIFGAWVDLREGATFGAVFTLEMGPDKAVFVPRGVGNAFQTLVPHTAYSYLVNEHWSAEAKDLYSFVNLADPALAIPWPHRLDDAQMSDADRNHPLLEDVQPVQPKKTLILGANGQLGRALVREFPAADAVGRDVVDLADLASLDRVDWSRYGCVINAAAHTAVDQAETDEGRASAWAINVTGVARLAELARQHRLTLVHVSSDYVFDGQSKTHDEDEPVSPLGVYGQTKAAGDVLVSAVSKHYIVRTSWVIGEGRNFVRTMWDLARKGVEPSVIDDQVGRLTFTQDLASGIAHLLASSAPYGIYNLTSGGEPMSWADIAALTFAKHDAESRIHRVSTATYGEGKSLAPRPQNSVLQLDKIQSTGFTIPDGRERLQTYIEVCRDK